MTTSEDKCIDIRAAQARDRRKHSRAYDSESDLPRGRWAPSLEGQPASAHPDIGSIPDPSP
jgi:hypothetical protein